MPKRNTIIKKNVIFFSLNILYKIALKHTRECEIAYSNRENRDMMKLYFNMILKVVLFYKTILMA